MHMRVTGLYAAVLVVATGAAWGLWRSAAPPSPNHFFGLVLPVWAVLASGVTGAFVIAEGWGNVRRRYRQMWYEPDGLVEPEVARSSFDDVALAVGVLIGLCICAQFAWPGTRGWGGYRLPALLSAVAGIVGAASLFTLANRRWSAGVADAGMFLLTLGVAGLVVGFMPIGSAELGARLPAHFNGLLVALALMVGFWCWLAGVWTQQLDNGQPWTTAGRIRALTPRFAFATGLLGATLAVLMSIWPAVAGTAHRDAGFGRIVSGVAGHLLLILVLLVSGRRWQRTEFYVVAGVTAVSQVAFFVVRAADAVAIER